MNRRSSTVKWLIATCVLVGALVVPATAAGKTHKLSGTVGGDPNATVSMKVVVKKGKPKKVKNFSWEGLDGFCDGMFAAEQGGTLSKSAPLAALNHFRAFAPYDQAASGGDVVDISGFVKRKGKKVVDGLISVAFNDGLCTGPPLGSRDFTATK